MRRFQKQQILDVIVSLHALHREVRDRLNGKDYQTVQTVLSDCQEAAVQVGEAIEQMEGIGTEAVSYLEYYCENIYQVSIQMQEMSAQKAHKLLENNLIKAENAVKHMPVRLEAVFLPYKVSMWDSLESVWMAADRDSDCDAYVIPIPYYTINKDGSLGKEHYEGNAYPDYVPVTHYNDYNFENRRPDMIFIHNPYDQYNYVTSVHPFFYSSNLKKFTDCLVYIPYYCTSGGMSEAQNCLASYYYVDYIVVQAEKYKKFFDPNLLQEKLLPLGSPKFDKIIHLCSNPPEPPAGWKEKMAGKKVYFYNTSINGMLGNTEAFLKKMKYVFQCFAQCDQACLLWRPHPLLESAFDSMRREYKSAYEKLKKFFIERGLGIYDDTSEIETTIALCDAYIGDAGTSVTSLFGVAGKPVFILNNNIHHKPQEDDWRGEIVTGFRIDGYDEWMITQGNRLYYSPNHDYQYEYYCDLAEYASGGYYSAAIEIDGKVYVCPANAQDILVIQNRNIVRKIELNHVLEQVGAFYCAWRINRYIFLIPNQYPAIVRLDTRSDEVAYIYEGKEVFAKDVNGKRRIGGNCIWKQYVLLASPDDNEVLAIDSESMKIQLLSTMAENHCGCAGMVAMDTEVWLLPYEGNTITSWNPDTGEMREFSNLPEGFRCQNRPHRYDCMERPFSMAVPYKDNILLSPCWGNMFLLLDKKTGEMQEWKMPFEISYKEKSEYYSSWAIGIFLRRTDSLGAWTYRYFHTLDRKLYDINLETREYIEIPIKFNKEELERHTAGFDRTSGWIMYSCMENVFHSLPDLLKDQVMGQPFDRDKQLQAYKEIAANLDGTCGEKIFQFVREKC